MSILKVFFIILFLCPIVGDWVRPEVFLSWDFPKCEIDGINIYLSPTEFTGAGPNDPMPPDFRVVSVPFEEGPSGTLSLAGRVSLWRLPRYWGDNYAVATSYRGNLESVFSNQIYFFWYWINDRRR